MTTYYVRPVNGNNGNAGTSFAAAWATTAHALSNVAAGDEVRLCAEGVETASARLDPSVTGSVGNWVTWRGASGVDGSIDGSQYTIQATHSGVLLRYAGGWKYYVWHDVVFDANDTASYCFRQTSNGNANAFVGCVFKGATSRGVETQSTTNNAFGATVFINCEFKDNAGDGLRSFSNNKGSVAVIGGSAHNNTGRGIDCGLHSDIYGVTVYANGSDGIRMQAGCDRSCIVGCTVHNNSGDGIDKASGAILHYYMHNSLVGNGGYGINFNGTTAEHGFCDFNHYHRNTSGDTDITKPGENNQDGEPVFASVVSGAQDFRPLDGSPLIRGGMFGLQAIGSVGIEAGRVQMPQSVTPAHVTEVV